MRAAFRRGRSAAVCVAMAAGLASPLGADAHAYLLAADPAPNAEVGPARALHLTFTEGVELAFCSVVLRTGDRVIATGPLGAGTDDTHVVVPLKGPLTRGTYTVEWHATAVDTHRTNGTYTFTVR